MEVNVYKLCGIYLILNYSTNSKLFRLNYAILLILSSRVISSNSFCKPIQCEIPMETVLSRCIRGVGCLIRFVDTITISVCIFRMRDILCSPQGDLNFRVPILPIFSLYSSKTAMPCQIRTAMPFSWNEQTDGSTTTPTFTISLVWAFLICC